MIFNGVKLIARPRNAWEKLLADQHSHAPQLIAAAFTAATLPAIAAVSGNLASAGLGHASNATAIQRAAIEFVSIAFGALIMIPALSLALLKIGTGARVNMTAQKAAAAAMALVWASWSCGIVLALPPLLNIRPEFGEFAWVLLALVCAYRVLVLTIDSGVSVSRRWRNKFTVEAMVAFTVLFVAVPVVPSLVMRFLVGVTGQVLYGAPPALDWPQPPEPTW
ncbi:MAG: hypothetical protein JXX29_20810 [Deltaproteobacteria bacterium]|nr:hypothetical protein [Deltaproteobacteria bacterium]MBN2674135.1 hypothetical protein [Deltaproteobacteria bacterium]